MRLPCMAGWSARLGGLFILLGTGLSMVLQDWQADIAMGVGLLGLVMVLWTKKNT